MSRSSSRLLAMAVAFDATEWTTHCAHACVSLLTRTRARAVCLSITTSRPIPLVVGRRGTQLTTVTQSQRSPPRSIDDAASHWAVPEPPPASSSLPGLLPPKREGRSLCDTNGASGTRQGIWVTAILRRGRDTAGRETAVVELRTCTAVQVGAGCMHNLVIVHGKSQISCFQFQIYKP